MFYQGCDISFKCCDDTKSELDGRSLEMAHNTEHIINNCKSEKKNGAAVTVAY
jgi:hypothetical protein